MRFGICFQKWWLRQNSDFFGAAISSEQPFFIKCSIFKTVTSSQYFFFRIATFSERNFYRATTSWELEILLKSYFSKHLSFWRSNCLEWRCLQKSYFFQVSISAKHLLFQTNYILEKANFQKSNIANYLLFLESCLLRLAIFSKDVNFYSSYLFRTTIFSQKNYSEEILFYSYAPLRSYTSYLSFSN